MRFRDTHCVLHAQRVGKQLIQVRVDGEIWRFKLSGYGLQWTANDHSAGSTQSSRSAGDTLREYLIGRIPEGSETAYFYSKIISGELTIEDGKRMLTGAHIVIGSETVPLA